MGAEKTSGQQVSEDAVPRPAIEIGTDPEGAESVMAELLDALVIAAAQDGDQMTDAKALAAAIDATERLARGVGGVPGFRCIQAVVAIAAGLRIVLIEVAQQVLTPAFGRFAVAEQGVELAAFDPFAFIAGLRVVDHPLERDHIAQAIAQPGFGRVAVATGTAGLLVITFNGFRQVEVGDEADIGLVDAHAEGDRRDHDDAVLAQKAALIVGTGRSGHAGVIGQCPETGFGQCLGDAVNLLAR